LELGIIPGQKGPFSQQFHFYLDVGNVLVTKVIDFEGVCVADAAADEPHVGSNRDAAGL